MSIHRLAPLAVLLLLALVPRASADSHPRILVLQSFGRHFAPFGAFATELRAELVAKSSVPLDVYEASLDFARFGNDRGDSFLAYLRDLFAPSQPDLVVTIGGAAAAFAQARRADLFPDVPLLLTGFERRRIDPAALTPQDVVAAFDLDLPAVAETILAVEPDTRTLFVILGSSPLERLWRADAERDFAAFADRLNVEWSTGLAFDAILERVAALPPEAAALYTLTILDGDGAAFEEDRALAAIAEASAAPVFGLYDSQLGAGVVGGRLLPTRAMAEAASDAAALLLAGVAPTDVTVPPLPLGPPTFDERQLRRHGIAPRQLPADGVVLFREPGLWARHRREILGAAALILVQTAFIAGLVASRRRLRTSRAALVDSEARLREAAAEARAFAGRLIHAQEDERARLARELHDDVTQRLAALSIEAGRAELAGGGMNAAALATMRGRLARLAGDVHALAYRLHPQILADLGLVAALESECERVADVDGLPVAFVARPGLGDAPPPVALCLFRVAQEALRNVVRHARASEARVTLDRHGGALRLVVEDDGVGFSPDAPRAGPRLGLASMRQRVAAVGGTLRIEARAGGGTRIEVRAPCDGGAPCDLAS